MSNKINRIETGPVRFGDDWAGVFIRGDNAFGYRIALEQLLSYVQSLEDTPVVLQAWTVQGLYDLLGSCIEPVAEDVQVQELKDASEVVKDEG